jgi:NAD(P)-dependent dehydrogenase (short-subunit alcohol dehydrogenase family)
MDMLGKICLVTGANTGIGKYTALGLAKRRATVIMVCRNQIEGRRIREDIQEKSWNDKVYLHVCDLASQQEIRKLSRDLSHQYSRLDVLVNNAAVLQPERRVTEEGIDHAWAINVIAPYLLTQELVPMMRYSDDARVVNVGSAMERFGESHWHDLYGQPDYDALQVYQNTKLALHMLSYQQATRLADVPISVNCLHPGLVKTQIIKDHYQLPPLQQLAYRLAKPFMLTPKEGAETSLYVACCDKLKGITGQYYIRKRLARSSKQSYDQAAAARLWDLCLKVTGDVTTHV